MSPRRFILLSTVASFGLVSAPGAFAEEDPVNPLSQIVVSATRTEQTLGTTGTSVSVITAEELRATQKIMLSDALRETPGVTVVRAGGPGMRGLPRGPVPGRRLAEAIVTGRRPEALAAFDPLR